MAHESHQRERNSYLQATADMLLPEGDHQASFLDFAREVLVLVRDAWPVESAAWCAALEARRQRDLSMSQWREVQSSISSYRVAIGEPYGMNEGHGEKATVSFLFALAIESPDASIHEYESPQLSILLDEFSGEFIEHFGRGQEVLRALKRAFHVVDA